MEYLKELYYDPMVFTSEGLRHLIAPERLSPAPQASLRPS